MLGSLRSVWQHKEGAPAPAAGKGKIKDKDKIVNGNQAAAREATSKTVETGPDGTTTASPPEETPKFTLKPEPVENLRPLRVVVIGAGFSGIAAAIR